MSAIPRFVYALPALLLLPFVWAMLQRPNETAEIFWTGLESVGLAHREKSQTEIVTERMTQVCRQDPTLCGLMLQVIDRAQKLPGKRAAETPAEKLTKSLPNL
jgi:hypothetical protein